MCGARRVACKCSGFTASSTNVYCRERRVWTAPQRVRPREPRAEAAGDSGDGPDDEHVADPALGGEQDQGDGGEGVHEQVAEIGVHDRIGFSQLDPDGYDVFHFPDFTFKMPADPFSDLFSRKGIFFLRDAFTS